MATRSRTFILSVPRLRQRRLSALAQILTTGLPFELVDGLDARAMRREMLKVPFNAWPLSSGEVACYLSHIGILQRVCDYDLDYALILEDDFLLCEHPSLSLATLWDLLPPDADHVQLSGTKDKLYQEYRVVSPGPVFNRVSPTNVGSWGYVASRKLAEYIVNHRATPNQPIDHLFIELSRRVEEFTFYDSEEMLIDCLPEESSTLDRKREAMRERPTLREWWAERWIRR
jgi:GR25 family glycosyltransferase involved in LPS biosynthesis